MYEPRWPHITIVILILLLGLHNLVKGEVLNSKELEVLTAATCHMETRGWADKEKDYLVSTAEAKGYCQVTIQTTSWLASRNNRFEKGWWNYHHRPTSFYFADLRIKACIYELKFKFKRYTLKGIIWCYNSGKHKLNPRWTLYIKTVYYRFQMDMHNLEESLSP